MKNWNFWVVDHEVWVEKSKEDHEDQGGRSEENNIRITTIKGDQQVLHGMAALMIAGEIAGRGALTNV